MTVLPTVRRQVEQAAERLAGGGAADAAPRRGARVRRLWRSRVLGWSLAAASVAVVAIVVILVARVHGRSASPTPAPETGGPGLGALVLRPGQAWYVVAIEQNTTPWQPRSTADQSTPPSTTVNASTRAAVVSRVEFKDWTVRSGAGRGYGRVIGKPRFIGSSAERALWRAEGSNPLVKLAPGPLTTSPAGFQVGDRTLTYGQLLHFPTDPAAVMRLFPPTRLLPVPNQFNELGTALEQVPLPPAARAALFGAITNLHGVQHLGSVRDPLGRPGIAFATTTPAERPPATGPGSTGGAPLPLRNELIFDPGTKALLASETVLLKPSPVPGIGTGYPISWTAFLRSQTVPHSSVPRLKPLLCAAGAVKLSLGRDVTPQTGEHAYVFALTNRSSTTCTLDGFPAVTLTHGTHQLAFVHRLGGPPYATSRKPQPVVLHPGERGYFLLAKYRCDAKSASIATVMSVSTITLGPIATLNLSRLGIRDLDYCHRHPGDQRIDPGNDLVVSAIEATAQMTIAPPS